MNGFYVKKFTLMIISFVLLMYPAVKMTPEGQNTFSKLITFKWKNILKAKASGFLEVAPFVPKSCNLGSIDCAKTQ